MTGVQTCALPIYPKFGSAQYSDALVDWIVQKYDSDPEFFAKTREEAYRRKDPPTATP